MAPLHGLCPRHAVVHAREGSCRTSLPTPPVEATGYEAACAVQPALSRPMPALRVALAPDW
jgi:hypothetical protein